MKRTDIMVDIETLGTSEASVVLSVGAVAFNRRDPSVPFATLYLGFGTGDCRKEQVEKGRVMDRDTIIWWNKQTPDAQRVLKTKNVENVLDALNQFVAFVDQTGVEPLVWGNGASFDNVILASLLKTYGVKQPWKYWSDRCYRTMKGEHQYDPIEHQGVHHNALDDAIHQAHILQSIYTKLQKAFK